MAVLTVSDIKKYLRYDASDTSNDDPLGIILDGAQRYIENYTGHLLTEREVSEGIKAFPTAPVSGEAPYFDLRWKPYKADTLEVTYLDSTLTAGEYEDFTIYPYEGTQRVIPASAWPAARGGIAFTYTAGYAAVGDIPDDIIHALAIYAGMSDEDRAAPNSAGWSTLEHLLYPYRLPVLA